jgi:hypothetical protein
LKKYFISNENFTENECKMICSGLDKFKKDIVGVLNSNDCDKITRKNGLSKIDLINSAKNRIVNHINDLPGNELIAMYCGLDGLNLEKNSDCDSAMRKLRIFFEAANIDIDAIINPSDDALNDFLVED